MIDFSMPTASQMLCGAPRVVISTRGQGCMRSTLYDIVAKHKEQFLPVHHPKGNCNTKLANLQMPQFQLKVGKYWKTPSTIINGLPHL